jgi:hypothetical protein
MRPATTETGVPRSDATPFETGVPETALAFRAALKRRR